MTKNNLLSEQLNYIGANKTPTRLTLCSYNAEGVLRNSGQDMKELEARLRPNAINWIQVHGLENTEVIQQVCRHFNIDFLTTQDILNSQHPTKIEEHDTYNVIILKLLMSDSGGKYQPQQFCLIQGDGFLLSFTEREKDFFDDIHAAIDKNVLKIRNRQADFLLSVLLNSVMASFMSIITSMEDKLEDLEEGLIVSDASTPGLEDLQAHRYNYRLIKKSIFPLKEQINKLLHAENALIHKTNRPFFNDVNDHLLFILQTLEGCHDMLLALVDAILSNNDRRMNSIMKQLTVVSTIFIPLTFLAGIWGMNFRFMPELDWKYGYLYAWALMLVLAAAIYCYFKRKNWY